MDVFRLLKLLSILKLANCEIFPNHNYLGLKRSMDFEILKNEMAQKRVQQLIGYSEKANDYPKENVISHDNIVGPIPSNIMKMLNITKYKPPILNDSYVSESGVNVVIVDPKNISDQHPSSSDLWDFIKPKQKKVNIHVFRGPNRKYTILGRHRKQEKYYSHWGYFVSQPAGSEAKKIETFPQLSDEIDFNYKYG